MLTKESKWSKLLAKSALVSVLAFSAGSGSALASGSTTTHAPVSVSQNTTSSSQAVTTLNETETETPGLLPGDFFYFVKTIFENIQLALTVKDVKEARLLTAFAQERLAEANALLAQGKIEEAKQSLQKSLVTQQKAVIKTYQASGTSPTAIPTATPTATPTAILQLNGEQTDDPEQSEAEDEIIPVNEVKNPEKVLKVKTDLQHNIVALSSALEKVKNPKAQLALMKNIEKSFAHLDKKLSNIESKNKAKLKQTNENVAAEEEHAPNALLVPAPVPTPASVPTPVPSAPASVKVEQEESVVVVEKANHAKKSEDKPNTNKSDKVKEEKNDNQRNGVGKEMDNGQKNKGSKQE